MPLGAMEGEVFDGKREKKMTRTEILKKKKTIDELIKSAYASSKDHLSAFPQFHHYRRNGISLHLELGRGDNLSSHLKQYMQKLLKVNMEGAYGSEWPAEEKVKRKEMVAHEALYIFVYEGTPECRNQNSRLVENEMAHARRIVGFVQYRFTIEEEIPVLYVYELQIEPLFQGKGLGEFLMQLIELIAQKNCMSAVVLTVQTRNSLAMKFYINKLRYIISAISPSRIDQQLRAGKSYEILCKAFNHEAKIVLEGNG